MRTLIPRGQSSTSNGSRDSPWAPRPFAAPRPRAAPAVPVATGGAAGSVQRVLSEAQQEVFDNLPGLIAGQPERALELLAEQDAADFRAFVAALSREDVDELMAKVRTGAGLAPFAQPYADLIGDIRNERIASSAEAMAGQLNWVTSGLTESLKPSPTGRNPQSATPNAQLTNNFTTWLNRGDAPEPTGLSNMNCWEACLFAGYKAGIFTKAILLQIYEEAIRFTHQVARAELAKQGPEKSVQAAIKPIQAAYQQAMGAFLGAQEGEELDEDEPPPRGYLLFFNGVSHVALSLGNMVDESPEVMSLWYLPGPQPVFKRTTLAKILADATSHYDITMAPPPW